MRFPVSVLIWRPETAESSALLPRVEAVLQRRAQELEPTRSTSWNYFGNREGLAGLNQLVEFASDSRVEAQQPHEANLQLWLGNQPQPKDQFEFVSMPSDANDEKTRLLEQWEMIVSKEPWFQVELLLWSVTSPTADWCQSHLNFCRFVLARELVQAVWNSFQSPDLRAVANKTNEYWGLRRFLEEAIREGALITDGRTPQQKAKLRRKNTLATKSGVVTGHSKTDQDIVAIVDTPESITAFEFASVS